MNRIARVYRNDTIASSTPNFVQIDATLTGITEGDVRWVDVDNDQDLDVVIGGRNSPATGGLYLYRNLGEDTSGNTSFASVSVPAFVGVRDASVTTGDFDNDGDSDLFVTGLEDLNYSSYLYRNQGGNFTRLTNHGISAVRWGAAAWGDYDGDHVLDLVVNGNETGGDAARLYHSSGCADLMLSASDVPTQTLAGEPITYTIVATNLGPQSATNVNLNATLPSGVSSALCSTVGLSGCSSSGSLRSASVASLTVNSTVTMTLVITAPNQSGWLTLTATGNANNESQSANNQSGAAVLLLAADPSISQAFVSNPVLAGEWTTMTLTVRNLGTFDTHNLVLTHTLASPLAGSNCQASGGGACTLAGNLLTTTFASLAGGGSEVVTLTLLVPDTPGSYVSNATVSGEPDISSANNSSSAALIISSQANVALAIENVPTLVASLQPLSYTLVVSNQGPHIARAVRITDTLPSGVSSVLCQVVGGSCIQVGNQLLISLSDLAPNANQRVTITQSAPITPGIIINSASLSASNDTSPLNNKVSAATIVLASSDVVVTAAVVPVRPATAGAPAGLLAASPVTITLVITNQGPQIATNVFLTDTLPNGVSQINCISQLQGNCQVSQGRVTLTYPELTVGASDRITLTMLTPNGSLQLNNRLTAISSSDLYLGNNQVDLPITVLRYISLTGVSPLPQALAVAPTASIILTFPTALDLSSVNTTSLVVQGGQGGVYSGTTGFDATNNRLTFTPNRPFQWGDEVRVTLNSALRSTTNDLVRPRQWAFTTGGTVGGCQVSFSPLTTGLPSLNDGMSAWGDYDGDGDLDLFMLGTLNGQTASRIYRNDGVGMNNGVATSINFSDIHAPLVNVKQGAGVWGDYDNDGDLDLVLVGDQATYLPFGAVYRNDGNDQFVQIDSGISGATSSTAAWGDYDNDGNLDLVVAGYNPNFSGQVATRLYRNLGAQATGSRFALVPVSLVGVVNGTLSWVDADNDGALDLMVTGNKKHITAGVEATSKLYRNERAQDGTVNLVESNVSLPSTIYGSAAWGDYDADGRSDLALSGWDGSANWVRLYHNESIAGSGAISLTQSASFTPLGSDTLHWGDYDNDGDLDLLTTAYDQYGTKIYRYDGGPNSAPTFTPVVPNLPGIMQGNVLWGDVDGDASLDLLISGFSGYSGPLTQLWRNSGCADLSVSLTAQPDPVVAGFPVTYTLTINNGGPQSVLNLLIKTTVPSGGSALSCQSVPVASCVVSGATVTTSYPALASNTSSQVTITLLAPSLSGVVTATTILTASNDLNNIGNSVSVALSVINLMKIADSYPLTNALLVAPQAAIAITFTKDLDLSSVTSHSLSIRSEQRGQLSGTLGYDPLAKRLTFTPTQPLSLGDVLRVVVSKDVRSLSDGALAPRQWQFSVGRSDGGCLPIYTDSNVSLPGQTESNILWGDYDNDGDLDVLLFRRDFTLSTPLLYRNDGTTYTAISTGLPAFADGWIDWGDFDGDGDLDLLLTGSVGVANLISNVYRNDGAGVGNSQIFTNIHAGLQGVGKGMAVWGDADNDGDLDVLLSGYTYLNFVNTRITRVYQNNGYTLSGDGDFRDAGAGLVGHENSVVTWADVDGDGRLDILANGSASGVYATRLYRNLGDFSFVQLNTGLPADLTSHIAWGDYDNDGDLDLALSGNSPLSTSIYTNDGSAALASGNPIFTLLATLSNDSNASLAWGDADNDGDLDLLTTGSYNTRLFRNNGASTDGSNRFTTVGLGLPGIAFGDGTWGDVDGDGDLDLLISGNSDSGTISRIYRSSGCADLVLQGNAAPDPLRPSTTLTYTIGITNQGSHLALSPLFTSTLPVGVGDLTCQGSATTSCVVSGRTVTATLADLPSYQSEWISLTLTAPTVNGLLVNALQVSARNESVTATNQALITTTVYNPLSVVAVDPAPGASSIAPTNRVAMTVSLPLDLNSIDARSVQLVGDMSGAITGTFTLDGSQQRLDFIPTKSLHWGEQVNVVATNGVQDAIGESLAPTQWQFKIGARSGGCPASFSSTNINLPLLFNSVSDWGDYDNDGDLDLLINGNNGQPITRIYRNDGADTFTDLQAGLPAMTGALAWGDYDVDGDLDLVLAGKDSGGQRRTLIYRNDGGNFSDINAGLPGVEWSSVDWGDYDNDGDLDLLLTGSRDGSGQPLSEIYRNDDGDHFTALGAGLIGILNGAGLWADYDQDGNLDLFLAGQTDSIGSATATSRIYRNYGNGIFAVVNSGLPAFRTVNAAWVDYDRDGDLDLLLNGSVDTLRSTQLYRNEGANGFKAVASFAAINTGSATWADYDNDGDPDLLLDGSTGFFGETHLYRNESLGSSTSFVDVSTGLPHVWGGKASWADYDGDQDLDLLLTGNAPGQWITQIYRNQGCADLALSQQASSDPLMAGEVMSYTVTVHNLGLQEAQNVTLLDTVPSALSGLTCAVTSGSCSVNGSTVNANFPLIAADSSQTLTLYATTPITPMLLTNQAQVSGSTDVHPANNSSVLTTAVEIPFDLAIVKYDLGAVNPGAWLTYTLVYTNSGYRTVSGVVISETVSTHATFVGPLGWQCVGQSCLWSVGTLASGQSDSVQFVVSVEDPFADGDYRITNTVQIGDDGGHGVELVTVNNVAQVTTWINTPTPTATPTDTATPTPTPSATATATPTDAVTPTPTATATPTFTPLPPVLVALSPTEGSTAGGILEISGANFGPDASVSVGDQECVVQEQSSTVIRCLFAPGVGIDYIVQVTSNGVASNGVLFSYSAPTIETISPETSWGDGELLTIQGSNFGADNATVTVGELDCPVDAQSHTQLVCVLPAGEGINLAVVVTTSDGRLATAVQRFSYNGPFIESVNPPTGPSEGGIDLTLNGVNFGADPQVTVSGQPCPVTSASNTQVICTLPPGTGGIALIELVASDQTSNQWPFGYDAPVLVKIDSPFVPTAGGVTVTLTGYNFGVVGALVEVDSQPVTAISQTDTSLSFIMPEGSAPNHRVRVVADGQTSNALRFDYLPPRIFSVSAGPQDTNGIASGLPTDPSLSDGRLITITGENFGANGMSVSLWGNPCTPTVVVEHKQLTCWVNLPGQGFQPVYVVVGPQSSNPGWVQFAPPSVESMNPLQGEASGGYTMTLHGNNFGTADANVRIGGVECPVLSQTHTEIQCQVPAGSGSDLAVELVVAEQAATEQLRFSYLSPTATPSATPTATASATATVTPTPTNSMTSTPTQTATPSTTPSATMTPSQTATPTFTNTAEAPTATPTLVSSPTVTVTSSATVTPSQTETPIPTSTEVPTATSTPKVGLEVALTVGGNGEQCATGTNFVAVPGSSIYYCATVKNVGDLPITDLQLEQSTNDLSAAALVDIAPGATQVFTHTQFSELGPITVSGDMTLTLTLRASAGSDPSPQQPTAIVVTAQASAHTWLDSDADTIPDTIEGEGDADQDQLPNRLDPDSNNNGIPDQQEVGSDVFVPQDSDHDGVPDYLEMDTNVNGMRLYLPIITSQ
ncbi:MAG: FG-GAP-like repeat-containing protein [Caldilineaceae bacterium]